MSTYVLTVSTPDGTLLKEPVFSLSLRGAEGDLAILPGHMPFATVVRPGVCKIEMEDGEIKVGRSEGGILTVTSQGATLLSSTFRWETEEVKTR